MRRTEIPAPPLVHQPALRTAPEKLTELLLAHLSTHARNGEET